MQPFAITTQGTGANAVQIVDPLHPDIIKLLDKRPPYWLEVPLVWPTPRTLGQGIQQPTQERRFDLLIVGARSVLNYSLIKLRNDTTDEYYSNDFITISALTGGAGPNRMEFRWESYIYLPAQTQLVVEALLGETSPGSGTLEPDASIVFDCVRINN